MECPCQVGDVECLETQASARRRRVENFRVNQRVHAPEADLTECKADGNVAPTGTVTSGSTITEFTTNLCNA